MKREALVFSPNGRILTYRGIPDGDHKPCVSSWDLQTGGLVNTIRLQESEYRWSVVSSIAYSASGGIVGVFDWEYFFSYNLNIFICDVASGAYVHYYRRCPEIPLSYDIWTYGESFRFATADEATITIWEAGSTLDIECTEVETLPTPVGFVHKYHFHGTTDRPPPDFLRICTFGDTILLAYIRSERILVWDVRNLKCLLDYEDATLDCEDARPNEHMFSSDGRFLACVARHSTIYLWKESPTGYILHRILRSSIPLSNVFPSPNGESVIAFKDLIIQLWRTREITTPPSGALTRGPQYRQEFLLDFSPDGTLAVVRAMDGNTVMVLNLESDVLQLTIDAGTKVYGLRVIGNTVVVVGMKESVDLVFPGTEVISWNLPTGNCVPDARVDREDSTQTVYLHGRWRDDREPRATISSDFRYVALSFSLYDKGQRVRIHSASTGEHLQTVETSRGHDTNTLWFTPDGSHVCFVATSGEAEVWRVGEQGAPKRLELVADIEHAPEGYPWRSSRGYRVTNDWWILGPDGKRLLMLPPPWQSYPVRRVWKGKFLALLHGELSEPVILEMEP